MRQGTIFVFQNKVAALIEDARTQLFFKILRFKYQSVSRQKSGYCTNKNLKDLQSCCESLNFNGLRRENLSLHCKMIIYQEFSTSESNVVRKTFFLTCIHL